MGFAGPGGARGEAGASRPAGRGGVRRRRLRDDDERHDDGARTGHPDHHVSSSTTARSAGCCTAAGRSPPSSPTSTCRDRPRDGLQRRARRGTRPSSGRRSPRRLNARVPTVIDVRTRWRCVRRYHLAAGGSPRHREGDGLDPGTATVCRSAPSGRPSATKAAPVNRTPDGGRNPRRSPFPRACQSGPSGWRRMSARQSRMP